MRILHVIDSAGIYGAEVMLLNLMQEQQRLGIQPILGSIGKISEQEKEIECEARRRKIKVIKLRMGIGYSIGRAIRLVRTASYHEIDLFHSHGYKGNILLGSLPKKVRKIPLVCTLHGWSSTKRISRISLYELLDAFFLPRIDAVVLVSSFRSKGLRGRRLQHSKTVVIENGIPELDFDSDIVLTKDPKIRQFCHDAFVLGAIGRLSEEKGFGHLIRALVYLLDRNRDYRVVIIGTGPQRDQLKRMIKGERLSNKVLLTGYRESAFQYLPFFDAFVLPSLTEGLPITLLEAMQAQIPIAASTVGGVPAVLGSGAYGILVEPANPKALADGISWLRENLHSANEMARKARHISLTRYNSRAMAEGYSQVYEEVLRNKIG